MREEGDKINFGIIIKYVCAYFEVAIDIAVDDALTANGDV